MKYFPKRSNCLCYCRRWNCFVVMLMIGLRLDLIVNLTWRVAAVVDELERWRLLLYCRCYSYYLQFVPECPMHTLNTNRDSMATARDSQRALYTTDIEVLPPLHEHSTLLPRFSSKCSLNSLSLIYFRLSHWITHTKPNQPTKFFVNVLFFRAVRNFFGRANIYCGISNGTYVIRFVFVSYCLQLFALIPPSMVVVVVVVCVIATADSVSFVILFFSRAYEHYVEFSFIALLWLLELALE